MILFSILKPFSGFFCCNMILRILYYIYVIFIKRGKTMVHPEWATKYKEKGMELRFINGRYYLYRVSSVYDKTLKRAKKITGEFLGCITEEDGLIPPRTRIKKASMPKPREVGSVSNKEYAATKILQDLSADILKELEICFPSRWREIFMLSANRLLHKAPLKNMQLLYEECFFSQEHKALNLTANALTDFMQKLGRDREIATKFMRKFVTGAEALVFDITDVVSQSKKIKMSEKGYNSHYNFDPQINLFYIFATDTQSPVFYRIFPGNISGMKALKLSLQEASIENAMVIGDKGFASEENINMLEEMSLNFILPLKRDSSYLDHQRLQSRRYEEAFDGHFLYHKRPIFYYSLPSYNLVILVQKPTEFLANEAYLYKAEGEWQITIDGHDFNITGAKLIKMLDENAEVTNKPLFQLLTSFLRTKGVEGINFDPKKKIMIFCDESLSLEEKVSYLSRVDTEIEGYNMENYKTKQLLFGTIGMITNMTDKQPKKIYESFKTRMEVETVFDAYKNLIEADRSYMQSDKAINAWMFINHIAVMMYYKLLNLIKSKDMISKISPSDLLLRLSKIHKIKINDEWYLSEINAKSAKMLDKLGISIT